MRRIIVMLSFLGLLAQPVSAQQLMGIPVFQPNCVTGGAAVIPAGPVVAIPVQSSCPMGITGYAAPVAPAVSCPSGAAASIAPTVEPVAIPKKHWWNRQRTGWRAVCPSCSSVTGGAAPIYQTSQAVGITRGHLWEKNRVEMMPVYPSVPTGGAVSINTNTCPISVPTGAACPVFSCPSAPAPVVQPLPSTGGAAPIMPKRAVKGRW